MIRGGAILTNDKDIDLGTYYDSIIEEIPNLGLELFSKGYEVIVNDSKISITKEKARVTIHLYRLACSLYTKKLVYGKSHPLIGNAINYLILDGLTAPYQDYFNRGMKKKLITLVKKNIMKLPRHLKLNLYKLFVNFGVKIGVFKYYRLIYPSKFFDNLRQIDFYGEKVNVSHFSEEYLEYCYGNTWKDPEVRKTFPKDGYYQIVSKNSENYPLGVEK
jgi:hypothetical protein